MMKTIPKNRSDAFLKRVTEATSYSLDSHFQGVRISDLDRMREWQTKLGGKVRADEETKRGQIHYHGNSWVEFRFQ